LALLFLVIALVLIVYYEQQLKRSQRYVTITARGFRPHRVPLGSLKAPLAALAVGILFVTAALPLFMLLWRSLLRFYLYPSAAALKHLSLVAYADLISEPTMTAVLRNTAMMATTTVVFTITLSALVAWLTVGAPIATAWRRRLRMLTSVPLGIPSVVVGVAFVVTYLRVPIPIYGTIWIIALALSTKFIAYTTNTLVAAQMQIAPELEEASLITGAGALSTYRRILAPLLAPALINCSLWVLIHAVRELAIALMLYSPSSQVLSTQVWGLWQGGVMAELCALGVLFALALAALLALSAVLPQRLRRWAR
jgi:iron(III) transport system permease protein